MGTTGGTPTVINAVGSCTVTVTAQVIGMGLTRSYSGRRTFIPETLKVAFTLLPNGSQHYRATLQGPCVRRDGQRSIQTSWCYANDVMPADWLKPYLEWPVITVSGGVWGEV